VTKRVWIIVALLGIAGALAFLAFGEIGKNLVYYWTPTELLAAGNKAYAATIRLGGQVQPGSLNWNPQATDLRFVVTDGAAQVHVHATTVPPQMFREGIGVVVEGKFTRDNVFESQRLLVKHSNEYQAPADHSAKDLKTLMRSVQEE
jgi:cytochrome c-type biogenesis protein CcmE